MGKTSAQSWLLKETSAQVPMVSVSSEQFGFVMTIYIIFPNFKNNTVFTIRTLTLSSPRALPPPLPPLPYL